jgi:hypothetical protein
MSESIFSSYSETLNERQPYMVEILTGYTRLRSIQSVRGRCLRSSLAHGLIAGQSPMELGMSSSSLTSINLPVLDSHQPNKDSCKKLLAC